jgi:hypothetical protein
VKKSRKLCIFYVLLLISGLNMQISAQQFKNNDTISSANISYSNFLLLVHGSSSVFNKGDGYFSTAVELGHLFRIGEIDGMPLLCNPRIGAGLPLHFPIDVLVLLKYKSGFYWLAGLSGKYFLETPQAFDSHSYSFDFTHFFQNVYATAGFGGALAGPLLYELQINAGFKKNIYEYWIPNGEYWNAERIYTGPDLRLTFALALCL